MEKALILVNIIKVKTLLIVRLQGFISNIKKLQDILFFPQYKRY